VLDAGGVGFLASQFDLDLGGMQVMASVPQDLASSYRMLSAISFGPSDADGVSLRVRSVGELPFVETVDLADFLPRVFDIALGGADPMRPEVTWSTAAPMDQADGGMIGVEWFDASGDGSWTLMVPPDALMVRLPALPDDLAPERRPDGDAVGFVLSASSFADLDHVDGYPALREHDLRGPDPVDSLVRLSLVEP
jgi:hypothetical protein